VRSFSRSARVARVVIAVAMAAGLLVTSVGRAPDAHAYPADVVEFEGHGWGHGRGLGQYGSLGYAVEHGWNHARILDHYYGGTTMGSRADGIIKVKLVEHDSTPSAPKPMVVTSAARFTVASNRLDTFEAGQSARVRWNGSGWDIERGVGCAGPWVKVGASVPASVFVQARTTYAGDDVNQMLNVCGQNRRAYRGAVMIRIVDTNFIRVINDVPMEQYLRGVVPRESPASWADVGGGRGIEALKAQSVAARSYAWGENRNPGTNAFQTCDTISCQVYGGAGLNGTRIEDARTDRAVRETAGQIRVHGNGAVARTEFSSSTGGYTAGGTFPAVPDLGDSIAANPNRNWRMTTPVAVIEQNMPEIGTLQSITVTKRNGLGRDGGRVVEVRVTGTKGSTLLNGEQARSRFAIKSSWFYVIDPTLNAPAVGLSGSGTGYVLTSTTGEAMAGAGGTTHGSMEGRSIPKPVVGVAATPSGRGYWLAGSDGSVYAFGDAPDRGSMRGKPLNHPVVGIASTTTGQGYWLVASDGGIFSFGDAPFLGSMGGVRLNQPMVGMAADPDGKGYWTVARDGGIFSFHAQFHGSTGAMRLNQPIVGMTANPKGGYWFVAGDGGVFTFPADPRRFHGSLGDRTLPAPVVGMASTRTGDGYWLLDRNGTVYRFGDAR
jgi:SpoIID/LytB domain protein